MTGKVTIRAGASMPDEQPLPFDDQQDVQPKPQRQKRTAPAQVAPNMALQPENTPKSGTCTDENGRVIGWRVPNALQKIKVLDMIGANSSGNSAVAGQLMLAASVVSINGERVSFPINRLQLEAIVGRLDDEGLSAIALSFRDNNPSASGDAEMDDEAETVVDRAKN